MTDIHTRIISPDRENARTIVSLRRTELEAAGVTDSKVLNEHADPSNAIAVAKQLELMGVDSIAHIGAYREDQLVGFMTLTHLSIGHIKPFLTPAENIGVGIGSILDKNSDSSDKWRILEGDQLVISEAATEDGREKTNVFASLLNFAIAGSDDRDIFIKHSISDPVTEISRELRFETTRRQGVVNGASRELYVRHG